MDLQSKLADAEALDAKRNAKARDDRLERDNCEVLWHTVREAQEKAEPETLKQLAAAVVKLYGDDALTQLRAKYVADVEAVDPAKDSLATYHLRKLTAKITLCEALTEAAKPDVDDAAITSLVSKSWATYANLDAQDVCDDLGHSRKVDAERDEQQTVIRGKHALSLAQLLSLSHGYEGPSTVLRNPTAITNDDAAKELRTNKGTISRAFDQLFGSDDKKTGFDRYRALCAAGESALRRWFVQKSNEGRESDTVSLQATELPV